MSVSDPSVQTAPVAFVGEHTAFFYGTLMVPQILHRVCFSGSKLNDKSKASMAAGLTIKPAILHDYCRHKVRYADYPGIVAEEGHSVRGTYVTGLTRLYIQNLDVFEGDEYRRSKVKVQLLKPDGNKQLVETGEEVETETYVWFDRRSNLETEEWDFEEFRRSKLHRWVDSSEEYQEVDELAGAEHDPTGGRGVGSTASAKIDEDEQEEMLHSAV